MNLSFWKSEKGMKIRSLLSIPLIYSIVIPIILLHIIGEIYHQICFRLYGIPLVKTSEYIVIDRQELPYLTFMGKLSCIYCGYVNGVIAYASEIAGRTERFFCPIKHVKKLKNPHSQYKFFMNRKDGKRYRAFLNKMHDFSDLK